MPKDYRIDFIQEVERSLALHYDPDEIARISNIVTRTLSGYEITERCTDLVPQDDINEKLIKRYAACMMVDGPPTCFVCTTPFTVQAPSALTV